MRRRGFVLLAVLWIIVSLGIITGLLGLVANRALAAARSEHDRTVGQWASEGCIARVQSLLDAALFAAGPHAGTVWRGANQLAIQSGPLLTGCDLTFRIERDSVSSDDTTAILDTLPTLAREPNAWLVRSQVHLGVPSTPVNLEVRFVRAGNRAALVRWVEW